MAFDREPQYLSKHLKDLPAEMCIPANTEGEPVLEKVTPEKPASKKSEPMHQHASDGKGGTGVRSHDTASHLTTSRDGMAVLEERKRAVASAKRK